MSNVLCRFLFGYKGNILRAILMVPAILIKPEVKRPKFYTLAFQTTHFYVFLLFSEFVAKLPAHLANYGDLASFFTGSVSNSSHVFFLSPPLPKKMIQIKNSMFHDFSSEISRYNLIHQITFYSRLMYFFLFITRTISILSAKQ